MLKSVGYALGLLETCLRAKHSKTNNNKKPSNYNHITTAYRKTCKTEFAQRNCGTDNLCRCWPILDPTHSSIRTGIRCDNRVDCIHCWHCHQHRSNSLVCGATICWIRVYRRPFVCALWWKRHGDCIHRYTSIHPNQYKCVWDENPNQGIILFLGKLSPTIREHFVGLGDFFKTPIWLFLVVGIFVRMPFERQLPISV